MALGIDNLKKVLGFLVGFANKADELTQDGLQWNDALAIVPQLPEGIKALGAARDAYDEFAELSLEEREELLTYLQEKFDIADEDLEDVVEAAFDVLFSIADLVATIKVALKK